MKSKKKGYVFLLKDFLKDNMCKIGVTRGDIDKRIKKLQTGNAGEIYLFAKYETDFPFLVEHNLHMKYCSKRIKNEWFYLEIPDMMSFESDCMEIERNIECLRDNPFMAKYFN